MPGEHVSGRAADNGCLSGPVRHAVLLEAEAPGAGTTRPRQPLPAHPLEPGLLTPGGV